MDHSLRPHRTAAAAAAAVPTAGGREDCWSEGATEALVEAWGERFLQLNRGNLRQKDWQDVSIAVNDHQEALGKPRRTDVQCKNRIDTLKKKYKAEKEKARRGPSLWRFFSRMDYLVGPAVATAAGGSGSGGGGGGGNTKKIVHHSAAVAAAAAAAAAARSEHPAIRPPLTFKFKNRSTGNANPNSSSNPPTAAQMRARMNQSSQASSESSRGDSAGNGRDLEDDEDDEAEEEEKDKSMFRLAEVPSGMKRKWENSGSAAASGRRDHRPHAPHATNKREEEEDDEEEGEPDDAFGELAQAIVKFSEIYERVESSRHEQMVQLERQRMEFAKDLEFQRMQMFMDAQIEIEKMKRPKRSSSSASPGEESQAYLPFAFFLTGFPALDH